MAKYSIYVGPYGSPTKYMFKNGVSGGCWLQTCGARRVRDLDMPTTQFCQGRLTRAPRLVEVV